jgi:hypothetical protein
VNKIIRELLALLWKAFKLVFWKWLRPMIGRLVLYGVVLAGLIVALIVLVAR